MATASHCQQREIGRAHVEFSSKSESDIKSLNTVKRKRNSGEPPARMELKLTNWEQSSTDVTFKLESNEKIQEHDLDSEVKNDGILITIKGGPSWSCKFYEEIEKSATNVGIHNNTILVKISKKMKGKEWLELSMETMTNGFENHAEINSKDDQTEDKKESDLKDTDLYQLTHVKNDWYERQNICAVHIYVKNLKKDAVQVSFEEKFIGVRFSTCDPTFLSMHKGSTEDTAFYWGFEIAEYIIPTLCKYKVSPGKIMLDLHKKDDHKKWKALEAPENASSVTAVQDSKWLSPSTKSTAKVAPTQDVSKTFNRPSQSPPRAKEGLLKAANKTGVVFDEMTNDKNARPISKSLMSSSKDGKDSQKPTCMVPPLNKSMADKPTVVSDGMTGLDNLGNTCFMNSVLQVLSNTRELRDYFTESHFQKEINIENPLGMQGKLAVTFACLLRILWSGKQYSYAPSKLKNLVAQKATQFSGFAQHDAQEFMAFLLDGLHEDLNRIHNKPYTQVVDSDGRSDEVMANEAWEVHKKRNDSFIVDLFQGQYKSKLVCPVCGKVSITFDPFMMLPVPLPKKQRLLNVTFLSRDPYTRPIQYMLKLPRDAAVEHLKEAVFAKTKVHPRDMRVFEVHKHGIHQYFDKGSSLMGVSNSVKIFVCEVLSQKVAGEAVVEIAVMQRAQVPQNAVTRCTACSKIAPPASKLRRCGRCYRAAYCDQTCQRQHWSTHKSQCGMNPELIGQPFYISLPESQATYSQIVRMAQTSARYSVELFQPPQSEVSLTEDSNRTSPTRSEPQTPNTLTPSTSSSTVCGDISDQDKDIESLELKQEWDNVPENGSSKDRPDTFMEIDQDSAESPSGTPPGASSMDQASLSNSASDSSLSHGLPTKFVMARTQDVLDKRLIQFLLWPANKDGRNIEGVSPLENAGDQPLELGSVVYLAMEWKNNDRCKPYVMVQSKDDIDCDEDPSMEKESLDVAEENTLGQCLSLFTEPEVLSPEHAWYCPKCKEHREATKQLSIWRMPHTLIIQLKRFSFRNVLLRDKIDTFIKFPTRKLDLSKYYIGNRPLNEPPPVYDLYGVVNHYGGILGGHYTAFTRCPGPESQSRDEVGWRLFDDSMVSMVNENQVVSRGAYVLFYRRRNSVVSVPVPLLTSPEVELNPDQIDQRSTTTDQPPSEQTEPVVMETAREESEDEDEVDLAIGSIDVHDRFAAGEGVIQADNRMDYDKLSYTDMDSVD